MAQPHTHTDNSGVRRHHWCPQVPHARPASDGPSKRHQRQSCLPRAHAEAQQDENCAQVYFGGSRWPQTYSYPKPRSYQGHDWESGVHTRRSPHHDHSTLSGVVRQPQHKQLNTAHSGRLANPAGLPASLPGLSTSHGCARVDHSPALRRDNQHP